MDDVPIGMMRNSRPKDQSFAPQEYLFRRIHPMHWHERFVDRAAIALPDMSVGRSKYGHPAWLRVGDSSFLDWAIVGFQVGDLPGELLHLGVEHWTFAAVHVPLENNYPHSEVWAFKDGNHVNAKAAFDPVMHLRWKDLMRWKIKTFLRPFQEAPIPNDPPELF